ncbi:MAG: TRAP transporter large permease [Lachnospiraceae bacterium]|nr:TRAP transporter large permease [Lachnospiraceae bacterium]
MAGELIAVLFLILFLIFVGVAVPFSFLSGCIIFCLWTGSSTGNFIQTSFTALNSYSIIAMPMFMIAGTLIDKSGIAATLIAAAQKLVGKVKGGMAMTIPIVACFFGALSGSGTATCATLSSMMVPELEQVGYKKGYLCALVAACGPLGYMIPPNVNALIFNRVASEASVAELFLSTIVPGIVWAGMYLVLILLFYQKYYTPVQEEGDVIYKKQDSRQERKTFITGVLAALGMPVIIMGGIYGGIFSATEAGAVGCLYALIIGMVVFKKFNLKGAFQCFVDSGINLGSMMILFPMTYIFSRILVLNNVPTLLTTWILSISDNRYIVLAMIALILFIAGFFVDCNVLQLVFVPLLLPLCHMIGVSATHLAVILFVCIGVGTITPPMAMNIFLTARICQVDIKEVIRPIWPFVFLVGVPMILIVTYVPAFSEFLPHLIMK